MKLQRKKQDSEAAVLNLEEREREDREKKKKEKEEVQDKEGEERLMQIDNFEAAAAEEEGKGDQGDAPNSNNKTTYSGFVPAKFSQILHKLHGGTSSQRRKKKKAGSGSSSNGRAAAAAKHLSTVRNTNDGSKSSSVLKGHPHTLNDLEATQMKQALYQSGGGISTALLQDSVLLGSDTLASRQARQKWQQFKKGGWKPEGAREEEIEMDFIQREKLERAERILKLGVEAAIEEEL
jgi:hypothetical protein